MRSLTEAEIELICGGLSSDDSSDIVVTASSGSGDNGPGANTSTIATNTTPNGNSNHASPGSLIPGTQHGISASQASAILTSLTYTQSSITASNESYGGVPTTPNEANLSQINLSLFYPDPNAATMFVDNAGNIWIDRDHNGTLDVELVPNGNGNGWNVYYGANQTNPGTPITALPN